MFPCVEIKLDGILHNLKLLQTACESRGIHLSLVTKVLGGNRELVSRIVTQGNITTICDSRIENLKAFTDLKAEKWLIRSPMRSEVADAVKYADVSLNSELSVLQALNEEALCQGKQHKVILMLECGDLREGCYPEELSQILTACRNMQGILVYGIGTNLSCLNDVVPTPENMDHFIHTVNELQDQHNVTFPVVSGGASSGVVLLMEDMLPAQINSLRMGEAVFLGNIPVYDKPFAGARTDNFVLRAEVIEQKEKPSVPGENSELRIRAIVALGKQDVYLPGLSCVDKRIHIVGGSSDHIILDVTACAGDYNVGSTVSFCMNYNCLLNAMTSRYIHKNVI